MLKKLESKKLKKVKYLRGNFCTVQKLPLFFICKLKKICKK